MGLWIYTFKICRRVRTNPFLLSGDAVDIQKIVLTPDKRDSFITSVQRYFILK